MKIAIVDDLNFERKSVRELTLNYFKTNKYFQKLELEFFEFNSGEIFLNTFQADQYHIIFLDIYMNGLTGVDVANQLNVLDKKCNIIFFTTSTDHMLDGYDVHAVGYILKPVENHIVSFYKAIDRAMEKLNLDHSSLCVKTKFGHHNILFQNIIYLESSSRLLYLHMNSSTLNILGKYIDYSQKLLCDNRFLECYRNTIINMDYIDSILGNDFILTTKEQLPISRRKKAEVMEKYMSYFLEGKGHL